MKKITHYIRLLRTLIYSFFNEKNFNYKGTRLNYIFKKGATNYLFVVFPAVSKKPMFNYVTTFRKTPHNILFLKDTFGEPGSYFLGRDFKFNLYEIVDQLINKVTKGKKFIICSIGSSKGGSSALFYSLMCKQEVQKVFVGSPQYSLGEYFYYHGGKSYLKNICTNDDLSEAKKLDKFCHDLVLNSKKRITIYLYGSSNEDEFHLKDINLLINDLNKTKNKVTFIDGKFNRHEGLADSFKKFLMNDLNALLE